MERSSKLIIEVKNNKDTKEERIENVKHPSIEKYEEFDNTRDPMIKQTQNHIHKTEFHFQYQNDQSKGTYVESSFTGHMEEV